MGFKNGTDGNIKIAVDAIRAAQAAASFLSVTKGGHSAIVSPTGNEIATSYCAGASTDYDAGTSTQPPKGWPKPA